MADTDDNILTQAKERFERCFTYESAARANALADAKFLAGDSKNLWQWEPGVRKTRSGRPMLTLNKTRQHVLQICNEARQNKAQIKVTPTGGHATYEAAQVYSGIIRRIEYQSKAVDAYSTAAFHQIASGIGYCRVVTDYADEETMDQEIFIRRVPDPNTIYLDPDAKEFDKSDMRFAFVFQDTPRDQYEATHGKGESPAPAALDHSDGWNDHDHVREAEYWRRNDATVMLHQLVDGSLVRGDDMDPKMRPMIVKSREIAVPEIECFRIVGDKVTERSVWPGKYIPIVPWIGEETVIENRMDRKGHTRALIDAQRMYNYWSSSAVEQVALQGKSPYIGPARAIEGYTDQWRNANVENFAFLPYNDIDDAGQPIQRPERQQPPVMAQAYIQGMTIARDDMMMVSGQFQATFGQNGNEVSGVAIEQRQRQGDNATYHFIDNQGKGIRQIGRILLDLIPKVYDTARVTKIMAEDGTDSDIALVPNADQAHQHVAMTPQGPQPLTPEQAQAMQADPDQPDPKIIFSPSVGRYDVEADVGPSFGTRREESANAFAQIMAKNPSAFQLVGDFWAKNSDFPGADELAERLKRGLPPPYKAGPDPQLQAMQQQAQQLLGKADAEVSHLKAEIARLQEQAKEKAAELAIKDYDAETRRLSAVGSVDPMLVQMIARQLWEQMQQTPLHPEMAQHAAFEQSIVPPDPAAQPNGAMQ